MPKVFPVGSKRQQEFWRTAPRCDREALTNDEGQEDEPSEGADTRDLDTGVAEGKEEHSEVDVNVDVVLEGVERRRGVVAVSVLVHHLALECCVDLVANNASAHAGSDLTAARGSIGDGLGALFVDPRPLIVR
jgi:hypothetical protein